MELTLNKDQVSATAAALMLVIMMVNDAEETKEIQLVLEQIKDKLSE